MTDAETKLWQALRRRQINNLQFRRQHAVGDYVLDFYCPALRLAIEVDGGQHNAGRQQAADLQRSNWLGEQGIIVLRYWNNDVLTNLTGVLDNIARAIGERQPRTSPPPERGRSAVEDRREGVRTFTPTKKTPPRRATRADPPLSGEGEENSGDLISPTCRRKQ